MIREFWKKAETWCNNMCLKAQDCMVLEVIDSNLPPLVSDSYIAEWIHHEAECGCLDTEAKATKEAVTLA